MSVKVFVNDSTKFLGGPAVFKKRLLDGIKQTEDIHIVNNIHDTYNVELAFIRSQQKEKPVVLRIDGCYYTNETIRQNDSIKHSIRDADHVIFQSEFSKNMCCSMMSVMPKKFSVIRNGIDFDFIAKQEPNPHIAEGSFVCCADWRPNKRPYSTIRGFIKSGVKEKLYVIGDGVNSKKYKAKNVHFLGKLTPFQVVSVLKRCRYFLHLCHIDSCSNAVIEALACGLNVLCTNLGGSKELVKENGIVLNVDKWDGHSTVSFKKIDNIESKVVAKGIRRLMSLPPFKRDDLNIAHTVKSYTDILRAYGT